MQGEITSRHPLLTELRGETLTSSNHDRFGKERQERGSAQGSSSHIAAREPTRRHECPPTTHSHLSDGSTKHSKRSLGKTDRRSIHVIEALWFVFSHTAFQSALVMNCDDDCLTKANANYVCGKLMDVCLLTERANLKLKERKFYGTLTKKTADPRVASRKMESNFCPLREKQTTFTRVKPPCSPTRYGVSATVPRTLLAKFWKTKQITFLKVVTDRKHMGFRDSLHESFSTSTQGTLP